MSADTSGDSPPDGLLPRECSRVCARMTARASPWLLYPPASAPVSHTTISWCYVLEWQGSDEFCSTLRVKVLLVTEMPKFERPWVRRTFMCGTLGWNKLPIGLMNSRLSVNWFVQGSIDNCRLRLPRAWLFNIITKETKYINYKIELFMVNVDIVGQVRKRPRKMAADAGTDA